MASAKPTKPTSRCVRRPLTDYGPVQQRFLLKAFNEGVPIDDPMAVQVIRHGATRADLLERNGLIHKRTSKKGRMSWRLTDTGRGLVMAHTPVFLHRRGFPSYTSMPHQAMFGEPEVMDAAA